MNSLFLDQINKSLATGRSPGSRPVSKPSYLCHLTGRMIKPTTAHTSPYGPLHLEAALLFQGCLRQWHIAFDVTRLYCLQACYIRPKIRSVLYRFCATIPPWHLPTSHAGPIECPFNSSILSLTAGIGECALLPTIHSILAAPQ